jgi:hypothetical protein
MPGWAVANDIGHGDELDRPVFGQRQLDHIVLAGMDVWNHRTGQRGIFIDIQVVIEPFFTGKRG